ncbi:polysaccharide biosynthesis/export family protein [bacterium]|nr:polysaccharide biosynthesis/export family protein [bacterium]
MMISEFLTLIVIVLLCSVNHLSAQESTATEADLESIVEFRDEYYGQYTLGAGDIISVTINLASGEKTLSTKIEESPILTDGSIILPYVEKVQASGLTCSLLAMKITEELKKEFRNPFVIVEIINPKNQTVTVLGDLLNGIFPIMNGDRFFEFLARNVHSGKSSKNFLDEFVRAHIVRSDGSTMEVNLAKYIIDSDTLHNPLLQNRDRIFIRSMKINITVLGKVKKPNIYQLASPAQVPDAIAVAGGYGDNTVITEIKVIRRIQNKSVEFTIKPDFEQRDISGDILLQDGDVVYVSGKSKIDWHMAKDFVWTLNLLLSTAMLVLILKG